MYLKPEELSPAYQSYQIDLMTDENREEEARPAILAAVSLAKSFIAPKYDVIKIFDKEEPLYDDLLTEIIRDIAMYYLVRRTNADMLYTQAKERFDLALDLLDKIASSTISLDLPLLDANKDGRPDTYTAMGSCPKYRNDY